MSDVPFTVLDVSGAWVVYLASQESTSSCNCCRFLAKNRIVCSCTVASTSFCRSRSFTYGAAAQGHRNAGNSHDGEKLHKVIVMQAFVCGQSLAAFEPAEPWLLVIQVFSRTFKNCGLLQGSGGRPPRAVKGWCSLTWPSNCRSYCS